ncbi:hypothetical protein [Oryzibacter oryziterrae]|uniref:hypothetical protein n=1 Tax=Oryzibacter oryziterrae TaxID=2766474 RepID=UPI001F29487C|nr:hypothetical protein [Oryzibacter oryziterrae]
MSDHRGTRPKGRESLVETVESAARLIAKARQPAIGGLGTDVDGVRAALALGLKIGAIVDHAATVYERVDLRVLSDSGVMVTTAAEARHRGDLIVLVGPGAVAWAGHASVFDNGGGLYPWRGPRGVLCIGTGGARPAHMAIDGDVAVLGDDLPLDRVIGLLRARLGGRPVAASPEGLDVTAIDAAALQMKAASFGVVVADAHDFDHVAYDSLMALVKALNAETRFTTLAVPAHHHGRGANLVSAWTTGGRLPVGMGRGYPEQDDWRFDLERAVGAGEIDALVWVGALGPELPEWAGKVPTVALIHHGAQECRADVVIEVGVPGITHAGVLTDAIRDGFAHVEPRAPQDLPSVAEVLSLLSAAIKDKAA